jgi:hypothetical protein
MFYATGATRMPAPAVTDSPWLNQSPAITGWDRLGFFQGGTQWLLQAFLRNSAGARELTLQACPELVIPMLSCALCLLIIV